MNETITAYTAIPTKGKIAFSWSLMTALKFQLDGESLGQLLVRSAATEACKTYGPAFRALGKATFINAHRQEGGDEISVLFVWPDPHPEDAA